DTINYAWSSDSTKLIFDLSGHIASINPDGTGFTTIYIGNGDTLQAPTVNPIDGRIVVHTFHTGLGMVNADGSNPHYIPNTGAGDMWPVWSPDGTWIAFVHLEGPNFFQADGENGNYFKIRPDGSERTPLTFVAHAGAIGGFRSGAAFTADGSHVVTVGL